MTSLKRVVLLIVSFSVGCLLVFDFTKLRSSSTEGSANEVHPGNTVPAMLLKKNVEGLDDATVTACRERTPSRSQSGEEDAVLNKFFPHADHVEHGMFLELGALDGHHFSNTNTIEHCYRWDGLLIEGNPKNAHNLFANTDRKVKKVHEAICKDGVGSIKFTIEGGPVAGAFNSMADGFKKMWKHDGTGLVDVPCRPLQKILDQYKINHIDFFSLDVEGAELKVLETLDFKKTTVDVLIIEMDEWDLAKNEACRAMLRAGGMCKMPEGTVLRSDCWVSQKFSHMCE